MNRPRRTTLVTLLASMAILLAACGGGSESSPPADGGDGDAASGETVSLAGGQFSPASLTIAAGTTVTFTNTASHTVTEGTDGVAVDDPFVDEQGGADIEVVFDEAGTFNITCTIHPAMNMTITVEG